MSTCLVLFESVSPQHNEGKEVRKSNQLIEARYRLTLGEQRLILHLCSLIQNGDSDFKSYTIRVKDFAKMFGLEKQNNIYTAVESAAKELAGKRLDLSRDGKDIYVSWLSYVEYVEGSGVVKVEFHKSLKPYLLQLQEHGNFTKYQVNHVVNFRSQYSIRLYELLKQKAFTAEKRKFSRHFDIEVFRSILGVAPDEYGVFSNLRRKVIEPAVEEISKYAEFEITEVIYERGGRKVTAITFSVTIRADSELSVLQLEIDNPPEQPVHPVVQQLIGLGFAAELADRYKSKYGVRRIERNIAYAKAKQESGTVKDFPAFLNLSIKEDMGSAWEVLQTKQEQDKAQKEAQAAEREALAAKEHLKKMEALAAQNSTQHEKVNPNTAKTAAMARKLSELL